MTLSSWWGLVVTSMLCGLRPAGEALAQTRKPESWWEEVVQEAARTVHLGGRVGMKGRAGSGREKWLARSDRSLADVAVRSFLGTPRLEVEVCKFGVYILRFVFCAPGSKMEIEYTERSRSRSLQPPRSLRPLALPESFPPSLAHPAGPAQWADEPASTSAASRQTGYQARSRTP